MLDSYTGLKVTEIGADSFQQLLGAQINTLNATLASLHQQDYAPGLEKHFRDLAQSTPEPQSQINLLADLNLFNWIYPEAYAPESSGRLSEGTTRQIATDILGASPAEKLGSGDYKDAYLGPNNEVIRVQANTAHILGSVEARLFGNSHTEAQFSQSLGDNRIAAEIIDIPGYPADISEYVIPLNEALIQAQQSGDTNLTALLQEAMGANPLPQAGFIEADQDKTNGLGIALRQGQNGETSGFVVAFDFDWATRKTEQNGLKGVADQIQALKYEPKPIPVDKISHLKNFNRLQSRPILTANNRAEG
jgi:hypothetical protein